MYNYFMTVDPIAALNYLGLTPDQVFPLLVAGVAILYVIHRMISPVKKSLTRITNACIEMQTIVERDGAILHHHLVEAPGSPLSPTAYGVKLITESGLKDILDTQKAHLKKELQKRLPASYGEYDVQEAARTMLVAMNEDSMMGPVKQYAYENGLNADVILRAAGLWLRDDFLGNERQTSAWED